MADQLVSLGLTEIARELFARRPASPVSDPGPDLPYEPDVITPSMNLGREITPSDIVTARSQARQGKPKQWFEIFDEMLRNGPGPQISKAKLALSSAAISFLTPETLRDETDKSTDAQLARLIAEKAKGQFGPRMTELLPDWFDKASHGIVGFHVVIEPRGLDGKWERITVLEKIPPVRFEIIPETRELAYRPFPGDATSIPCRPFVEAGSLAVFRTGKGSLPLDTAGLLFQCVIPWSFASLGLRWLARLAEMFGIPLRLVWYDETKKGQKEIAERTGKRMGAGAWGAFPSGMKVEIKDALSGAGAGEVHEKLIRIANKTYDQVFHGHSQASNVEVGAESQTSTQEASGQSLDIHRARAAEAATDITDGLIRPWVRRNWGDDAAARLCPVLTIEIQERKDAEKIARTAGTLLNAGVSTIDEEGLVRACGLPYTADPEQAVKPRAAAPVFGEPAKLATVLPFPSRFAAEPADDGIGEEIVGPYREVIARAVRDGATPDQLLARLRHQSADPVEADKLVGALAVSGVNALMRGIVAARARRRR